MHVVAKGFRKRFSSRRLVSLSSVWRDGRKGVGMFSGKVNPVTGKMEWIAVERDVTSEDSDLSPELARSQYGDMLHDTVRVRIKWNIPQEFEHVLIKPWLDCDPR